MSQGTRGPQKPPFPPFLFLFFFYVPRQNKKKEKKMKTKSDFLPLTTSACYMYNTRFWIMWKKMKIKLIENVET